MRRVIHGMIAALGDASYPIMTGYDLYLGALTI